ncbi:MAG: lysophospholipid acyltransferase family protein [Candidatus Sedimenticola endophacoides]
MVLFRSIVFFLFLMLSTLFFGVLLATVGWLLPYRWRCLIANAWGRSNTFMLGLICGLRYTLEGAGNLPPEESVIILSKHQSAWETISLRGLLPPEQAWVLKRELMWVPVFGWALAAVQPIAIDRSAGRRAAKQIIETGIRRLKQGRNVIIFPEGTRVAPGERKKYGVGGALLAAQSGYPVIPIAHNAGSFWRRRGLKKYPGTIQVVIGPRIETAGKSAARINREVEGWIEATMARLPQRTA